MYTEGNTIALSLGKCYIATAYRKLHIYMLAYNCIHGNRDKLAKYVVAIVKLACPSKYVNVQAFWSLSGKDVQTPPESYCELCTYKQTNTHIHIQTNKHKHKHTHKHTYTHTHCTHTHTRTCKHAHIGTISVGRMFHE